MKTNFFLTALVALVGTAVFGQNVEGQRIAVIKHAAPGVFKVIYEGSAVGKVRMIIFDKSNETIFEDTNTTDGFIRKVNFTGMQPGEYTIQIADKNGKQSRTIVYGPDKSTIKDVSVVKMEEGRYLLAVSNESKEQIHVNIYDGESNLVHSSDMLIAGQLKMIYNLKNVDGIPTFQVTDAMGNIRTLAKN